MKLHALNRWITTRPGLTIVLFTLVTLGLAARIPELTIDTDVVSLMPEGHPERVLFEWAEDYFDARPAAVMIVVNDGAEGVFTPESLALIAHLSDELATLESIDDDVISLSAVDNIRGEEELLVVEPFFEELPATQQAARAIRDAVFANPMMVGRVVTKDAHAAAVAGRVLDGFDKGVLYDQLREIVARAPVGEARVVIAGRPILDGEWGRLARGDLRRMMPLVIATVAILLGLLLHSIRGAVLPVLVVLTSVAWTMGLMAWLGATLYAIGVLMPVLLIAIGVADGIHVIHLYALRRRIAPDAPIAQTVLETMDEIAAPVVMTSITTAAGFGSLALSPLTAVKSFGLFTGFGVLAAMVFSLTLLPALLCVLPPPKLSARRAGSAGSLGDPLARPMAALSRLVMKRPVLLAGIALAVTAAGLSGLPRIVVDGSLIQNFPADNPARQADAEFIRHFGGSYPMHIVLEADARDAWNDPVKLRAISRLQRHLEELGHTGKTRSLSDYVNRMHQVLNVGDAAAGDSPRDANQVAQYLLLYSMSGEPDDFEDVVDYERRKTCVHALVRADHSPLLKRVLADVEDYAAQHLEPLSIVTRVTGNAKIAYVFIDLITMGQVRSLLVALVLVALFTAVLYRAPTAGLLAVGPVAIAVALNFGALGWFGIPLGVTTAMISSIGIGIGVDYAIHLLASYRARRSEHSDPALAMRETLSTTGAAILYNALVVFAGFMVLASSYFPPNRVLGLLVAMNMLVCFGATVTLMAALLHRLQPAFTRASR
jgi:predicted RND superfamily exporter protein